MKHVLLVSALALSACGETLLDRKLDLVDASVTDTELRRLQMDAQENDTALVEHLTWVYEGRNAEYFTGFRGTVRELMLKEAKLVADESKNVLPEMIEDQETFERRYSALQEASLELTDMKLPSSRGMFGAWQGTYKFNNSLGLPVARLTYILSLNNGDEEIARHRGRGDNLKLDTVVETGEMRQGKYVMSTFGFDNDSFLSRRVKEIDPSNLSFRAELIDACNIENQCLMYGLRDQSQAIEQRNQALKDANEIIERYKK